MGKRFKELTEEQTKLLEEFELEDENEQIRDAAHETLKDGDWPRFKAFMEREGYWF